MFRSCLYTVCMHVVSPARYKPLPERRKKRPIIIWLLLPIVLVGVINYARPLPAATATIRITTPGTSTPTLAWPSGGQQAVAAVGYGQLGANGDQSPLATASIAKVILALCVLQKQPLPLGSSGPTFTMTSEDVDLYQTYVDKGGSLLPVREGQTLTEYEMLEALMVPSANNIADTLAQKVFGGQAKYAAYATNYLNQNGLTQTHIGTDASGYDASTTSTASELTQLGLLALKSPTLMQIAGERFATFPIVGRVQNYDTILGVHGITGLKTGNNDVDLGAFLFTATTRIGNKDVSLSGAVMGADDLASALQNSVTLVSSAQQGFEQVTLTKQGQAVGSMTTAWGQRSPITTTTALQLVRWKATPLTEKHSVRTDIHSGKVGTMQVAAGQAKTVTTLQLEHSLAGPSFWWRLTRH